MARPERGRSRSPYLRPMPGVPVLGAPAERWAVAKTWREGGTPAVSRQGERGVPARTKSLMRAPATSLFDICSIVKSWSASIVSTAAFLHNVLAKSTDLFRQVALGGALAARRTSASLPGLVVFLRRLHRRINSKHLISDQKPKVASTTVVGPCLALLSAELSPDIF